MNNATTFVGLDVHARSIKACAFVPATGEVERKSLGYEPGELASWIKSLPQPAKCAYESGVTGFDLQKRLSSMGIDCVVGAVSKMHRPAADRGRKTDRRDAHFLAVQLALGVVTEVHVPDLECEGARDLTRALADARDDAVRAKQRLSKFLLRHGHAFSEATPTGRRKGNWTAAHWAWIRSISFPEKADDDVLAHYVDAVRQAMEDKKRLERLVEAEASKPRWKKRVVAALLEGRRHHDGRRHRVRGRRVLKVQERQVVRRMARAHPLRAFQRGEREAGRHHQGRQQTCRILGSKRLLANPEIQLRGELEVLVE